MKNKTKPFNLQLIITEECNLQCSYCFEIEKTPKKMPVELAKDIINTELSADSKYNDITIDLSGGEPFLAFETLKEIVKFGINNRNKWNKRFRFFITSNLTLLDDEMKEWLKENKKWVIVGTSLDGTKEVHDLYRCNSYDDVVKNIPLIKELYPRQGIKMTIGPQTIKNIFESIKNVESFGVKCSANVVYENVWGNSEEKKNLLREFAKQLNLLIDHYVLNPELKVPNLISLPIHNLAREKEKDFRWCGSGYGMKAYDTEGNPLPCHRYSKFCAGKTYKGEEDYIPKTETKCDNCEFQNTCPTCPAFHWQENGNPYIQTGYHCEFIKLQLLASAKLEYLKNRSLVLENKDKEDNTFWKNKINALAKLQGAYFIFNKLNQEEIIESCN